MFNSVAWNRCSCLNLTRRLVCRTLLIMCLVGYVSTAHRRAVIDRVCIGVLYCSCLGRRWTYISGTITPRIARQRWESVGTLSLSIEVYLPTTDILIEWVWSVRGGALVLSYCYSLFNSCPFRFGQSFLVFAFLGCAEIRVNYYTGRVYYQSWF